MHEQWICKWCKWILFEGSILIWFDLNEGITSEYGPNPGCGRQSGSLSADPAGENHQREMMTSSRRVTSSSWSDYRDYTIDNSKTNSSQLHHEKQVAASSAVGQGPSQRGLKARSNSYDHYYADDYGSRGRGDMTKIIGPERHLPQHPHQHQPHHPHHHNPHHHHPPQHRPHPQTHHHAPTHPQAHHHPSHPHRPQRHPHPHRQHQSSSEEELRSNSECTSCDDVEVESISERGTLSNIFTTFYPLHVL